MTQGSESSSIIHPTLHYFGAETRHLERMLDWYALEFRKNPMGTFVDADKLVAARQAGMSFAELHRRVYTGEFAPSRPMDPRVLI